METNEISIHEVRCYLAFQESPGKWLTAQQVAEFAKVSERTARAKVKKFADLGLCDMAEVFPAHRYRLSDKAEKRNKAYAQRIEFAVSVFAE